MFSLHVSRELGEIQKYTLDSEEGSKERYGGGTKSLREGLLKSLSGEGQPPFTPQTTSGLDFAQGTSVLESKLVECRSAKLACLIIGIKAGNQEWLTTEMCYSTSLLFQDNETFFVE